MAWDHEALHLEIEIYPDGRYDWFFMERGSPRRAGAEAQPVGSFSPDFIQLVRVSSSFA